MAHENHVERTLLRSCPIHDGGERALKARTSVSQAVGVVHNEDEPSSAWFRHFCCVLKERRPRLQLRGIVYARDWCSERSLERCPLCLI